MLLYGEGALTLAIAQALRGRRVGRWASTLGSGAALLTINLEFATSTSRHGPGRALSGPIGRIYEDAQNRRGC